MIFGPLKPTTGDFEAALARAIDGMRLSEWHFSKEVLAALDHVALQPDAVRTAAARAAWLHTSHLARTLTGAEAVVFDVGETLVDETRAWTEVAAAVGVTPFTVMGLLGALIERGVDHREVWELLAVDPAPPTSILPRDLYPDALDCLRAVQAAGLLVGIAGNQPEGAEEQLRSIGARVDVLASSRGWGVEKPSPAFFRRLLAEVGAPADRVVYVGDRLDNDVLPARAVGMRAVLIRRGPWGYVHSERPEADAAAARIDSLAELTDHLRARDA